MSYRPLSPGEPTGLSATPAVADPSETGRRRRRWTTGALALLLAGGAVVGGHAIAQADEPVTSGSSTPSATAPASPTDSGSGSSAAGPQARPTPGRDGRPTPPDPEAAHTPHLGGEVVSSDGSTIEITDRDGFLRTIHTTSSTTFDGVSNPVGVGTRIDAEGTVDSDRTSLLATVVRAAPTPPEPGSAPAGPRAGGPGGAGAPTPPSDAPAPPSGSATPPSDAPAPPTGSATPPSAGTSGSSTTTAPGTSPSTSGS